MPRSVAPASAAGAPSPAPPASALGRPARILGVAGVAGLAALSFCPLSATRMHTWPWALLAATLTLFPLAAVARGIRAADTWRLPPRLLLAGALTLVLATLLAAVASPFRALSLARVGPTLGGVALFLWLHHAWSRPDGALPRSAIARALAWAGLLLVLVSLWQWSHGRWPLPWDTRNAAPFGHSTYTAGALVLSLPWLVARGLTTRGGTRLAWLAAAGLALVALGVTSSRGGVAALGATGAVAAVLTLGRARWSFPAKLILVLAAVAVGAGIVWTNPRLRELVIHRQWGETARESNDQRQAMLEAGQRLGALRPFTGWGPGTVALAYPEVRAELDGGTETILQLHNTPVQVWATTGLAGGAALLMLVVGTLIQARQVWSDPVGAAAGAALLGYGVMTLTDHQLDVPYLTALTAASLAALSSAGTSGLALTPSRSARLAAGGFLLCALLPPILASIADLRARHSYDRALTALETEGAEAFVAELDRAIALSPSDAFYQHQAAGARLEQRGAETDPARRRARTREAADRLIRSLTTGAHVEFAHFNLGWILLELGDWAESARHFQAAARRVPDKGGVYFGLGLALQAGGQRAAAVRAFALERLNDPRSATSPAWEVPALAALESDVAAEARRLLANLPRLDRAERMKDWVQWWWDAADRAPPPGYNDESRAFASAWPAMARGETIASSGYPWARAYAAWREQRPKPEPTAFLNVSGGDPAVASALARRARSHGTHFRDFLTAPAGDEPSLVLAYRRQRTGYGVLALHPEGPSLTDAFVVQENRAALLAAGVMPPKGWLPGRFLLALLPESP